ncbi:MAG: hypothetical protein ACKPB2_00175 [Sphaerospermopsis kisseleviana]|uniref:hypothetical protein n=1 Tax=Sphaerospermopsis reniformis TaxID=531300 RepID=UPI0010F6850F|nr:hypothetical protein [Sphaerospermopsis reniformis]
MPKITIQNFSNTLSHPKSDRTPPHSQKAIASHIPKAIPTERFAIALPHPQTAIALSHSQTSDIFGIIRILV